MTKEETADFQRNIREDFGESYTVKVDKVLDSDERNRLIAHVKNTIGDENISVLIIEPNVPDFNFNYSINQVDSAPKPARDKAQNLQITLPKNIYGEKWTVLQNRLLNAICPLDLNERRLIMFLSPLVRQAIDKDATQRTFVVKVLDFMKEFSIKSHAYYAELENTVKSLQQKFYEFWDFQADEKLTSKVRVTWISKGDYKENQGQIHIDLHDDLVEMLTVFDKTHPYTKYERKMISELGSHGVILFELIASCMFQKHKKKTYTINFLREKFSCVERYPSVSDFKRYVLDTAIKDIEKYTPYRISYVQKKISRAVTDIVFSFENIAAEKILTIAPGKIINDERIPKPKSLSWQTKGLSDNQIRKIAVNKDKFVEANQHLVSDKRADYYQAFEYLKTQLKDPNKLSQFYKIDEFLGFNKDAKLLNPPMTEPVKLQKQKDQSFKPLSSDEIERIVSNAQFQADYAKYNFSPEVGSPEHIESLRFKLKANQAEFIKKPLRSYL